MIRPGQAVALCALALLALGLVMVTSAGMSIGRTEPITAAGVLTSRSAAYAALAAAAMAIAAFLPIRRITTRLAGSPAEPGSPEETRTWVLLALSVLTLLALLACVYMPVIGHDVNGSHRWVRPVPTSDIGFQPSEVAKWAIIAVLAIYAARLGPGITRFWTGLIPALIALGLIGATVVYEDLGTGALIVAAGGLILIAAGARIWQFLLFVPIAAAMAAAAIITSPYRINRIISFLDPFQDPEGTGFHMIQSMVAVANGQLSGRGLGHGLQKFGYLPEDTTDFLFAIICEEMGVAGAAVIFALYGLLVWSALIIALREKQLAPKLIVIGVAATFGLQALINIAVVLGLAPTKGIALPLLSSGGTGWILTAASLGVIVSIDRTQPQPTQDNQPLAEEQDPELAPA